MIWLARYWKPLAGLVLAALMFGWGYYTARTAGLVALQVERTKAEKAIAEAAAAESAAKSKAWAKERQMVEYMAALDRKHAQEMNNVRSEEQNRVADLERGNVQLRREIGALYTERLSSGAAAAGELSEEARRGAARLGAVVRVVAEQDAQIRGLQDAYEAARAP